MAAAREPGFSLGFTALLAALLVAPLAVRMTTNAEPFPAILLPSGAGKVSISNGVATFYHLALYGYDQRGELRPIRPEGFLDPIPTHFIPAILGRGFGDEDPVESFSIEKPVRRTFAFERHRASPTEKATAKAWLRARLTSRGLSDAVLLVRNEESSVRVASGERISETVLDEKRIELR